jgi:WD40 repeat protein
MARLIFLFAIALAARGSLIVTSFNNDAVLRYDSSSGAFLGTLVPSGVGGLDQPRGIVVAPSGDVLVSSSATNQILRYSSAGAFIGVFADASSGLTGPYQLVLGPGGVLYVASSGSDAILRYDATTGAPLGAFVSNTMTTPLNTPRGLAIGNGRLYTSTEGDRIRIYDLATAALLTSPFGDNPRGLTIGPDLNLFASFGGPANLVEKYNGLTGASIGDFIASGSGGLAGPMGLAFGADGNLYVASQGTNEILRYNGSTGAPLGALVTTGSGGLNSPQFFTTLADVPEPGSVWIVAAGLAGLGCMRRAGRRGARRMRPVQRRSVSG